MNAFRSEAESSRHSFRSRGDVQMLELAPDKFFAKVELVFDSLVEELKSKSSRRALLLLLVGPSRLLDEEGMAEGASEVEEAVELFPNELLDLDGGSISGGNTLSDCGRVFEADGGLES